MMRAKESETTSNLNQFRDNKNEKGKMRSFSNHKHKDKVNKEIRLYFCVEVFFFCFNENKQ